MTTFRIITQIAAQVLAYINSCVNPILYAFLSDPFRWVLMMRVMLVRRDSDCYYGYLRTEWKMYTRKAGTVRERSRRWLRWYSDLFSLPLHRKAFRKVISCGPQRRSALNGRTDIERSLETRPLNPRPSPQILPMNNLLAKANHLSPSATVNNHTTNTSVTTSFTNGATRDDASCSPQPQEVRFLDNNTTGTLTTNYGGLSDGGSFNSTAGLE